MRYILNIPGRYPYKNELTPSAPFRTKKGRYVCRSYLTYRDWRKTFEDIIPQARGDQVARGPRTACVIRLMTGKERDMDLGNLQVGAVLIIDSLVSNWWLMEDDPNALTALHCDQVRVTDQDHGIRVIIGDVDAGESSSVCCPRCRSDLINIQDRKAPTLPFTPSNS